jgi:hypothetical protein
MATTDELTRAHQAGRNMRDAHKDRASVPMFEMGPDGHELRKAWQAGWNERDGEIKRKAA